MGKYIYSFGGGAAEGQADMRGLLGGKGANLAEMSRMALPVPPGFTITTDICNFYYNHNRHCPPDLWIQVTEALNQVEAETGTRFGDANNPLLLSVRSGAQVSMPGMMDTVLNLGLNDRTVRGLAEQSGDARFAWDSYRRFVQMYADVVLGLDHYLFEDRLARLKEERDAKLDMDLSAEDLQQLTKDYLALVREELEEDFPQEPMRQLQGAVEAVFASWMAQRAIVYRKLHDIPDDWGTAVTVQAMVFGNMGEDCATGVAFTRDPSTGDNVLYGEYLPNAQGEDVVAGLRTPHPLGGNSALSLEQAMPEIYAELQRVRETLERHYRDMQDIEFTVQKNRLYMLQTRSGKRTVHAAVKIACEMVKEGLIDQKTALCRIEPQSLDQILHPRLDPAAERQVIGKGLPASPGAASGVAVFSADEAEARNKTGEKVILVRTETTPEDIHGIHAAEGILTTRGGMTSHAAVVARGMGKPCVCGAGDMRVDTTARTLSAGGVNLEEGDWLTLDGGSGEIMAGRVATVQPKFSGDFARIMSWADDMRRLRVRANAETPQDAQTARELGAEGIGLCRTEHMFFEEDRITAMREMILAEDEAGRRTALDKIQPMQRRDFAALFRIMAGMPVTIRLLDPPLHEFLPRRKKEFKRLAKELDIPVERVRHRASQLQEFNPMLGHRGCRLLVSYPEIAEMQACAIFEAALDVEAETGAAPLCEIMIPLVGMQGELALLRGVVDRTAEQVAAEHGTCPDYVVGTMIELPRAALRAKAIAKEAAFFSFGTNDLTQTVFGLSRDDAAGFLGDYEKRGLLRHDPFARLDVEGVGELIRFATKKGRAARPDIKLGICGEHGGDPTSIQFCESIGLDYVSCSPFRLPVARLAAAQAAVRSEGIH